MPTPEGKVHHPHHTWTTWPSCDIIQNDVNYTTVTLHHNLYNMCIHTQSLLMDFNDTHTHTHYIAHWSKKCGLTWQAIRWSHGMFIATTYISKHLSTLSDMSSSMHSCSRANSWMSLSSPCPRFSHSNNVSGSTSAIVSRHLETDRVQWARDDVNKLKLCPSFQYFENTRYVNSS